MTEYFANYYQENKEKMKASALAYKAENAEKIKEQNKKYRKNYNKLNVICSKCKKLMLKSSYKRHCDRKH
tara:strand:- start:654 stop:863 length:210 start_codon:yes stop_codon:yes gene_type:complete